MRPEAFHMPCGVRRGGSSCFRPLGLVHLVKEDAAIQAHAGEDDSVLDHDHSFEIRSWSPVPWNATRFASSNVWGRHPLLMKGAFLNEIEEKDRSVFPSWDDILNLACEDTDTDYDFDEQEDIPSRLIKMKHPNKMDSFELVGFGPFENSLELDEQLATNTMASGSTSTLVVNDVDRWIPELSHWIDKNFASFIPRWRRDDAQISLANKGGGIGPHVDSYDVFLIQLSGTRVWEVGVDYRLSIQQEHEHLIEACSENGVRILNMTSLLSELDHSSSRTHETVSIQLGPGDCLYLPPRVMHCGTATSEKCTTLSVGCRAPSAADLMARLPESILQENSFLAAHESFHHRYAEDSLSSPNEVNPDDQGPASSYLSPEVKKIMKDMVLRAVQQALEDDDNILDQMVGKIATEPKRLTGGISMYPAPLYDMDEELRRQRGVWGSAASTLEDVIGKGNGCLRRAEGVAFAWSCVGAEKPFRTFRMYAHGRDPIQLVLSEHSEQQEAAVRKMLDQISNGKPLTRASFDEIGMDTSDGQVHKFLLELVEEGLIYGEDA